MARIGITYLQVAQVADELVARAQEPSIRLVRAGLGDTGSPNTIQRLLSEWREARPQVVAAAAELSASTLNAIAAEISQAAAKARSEVEAQLLQARAEAKELGSVGEQLELEREELLAKLVEVTTDRDQRIAINTLQVDELDDLRAALQRETASAEAARTAVAKVEIKLEMAAADRAEIVRLRQELAELTEKFVISDRTLAVSRAEIEAGAAAHQVALQQVSELREQLAVAHEARANEGSQLRVDIKSLRTELAQVGSELNKARVSEAAATGRLQAMLDAATKSEKAAISAKQS